jgi:hypothetical protein
LEYARKWTAGTDVHILEDEVFQRGGLRILGATLWTDFEIAAHEAGHLPVDMRRQTAISLCYHSLVDFREIYRSDKRGEGESGFLSANEMISRHKASRTFSSRGSSQDHSRDPRWF